jgi:hypothetical protein
MEDLLARDITPSEDLVFAYGQRAWDPVRRQVISREVELKPGGFNIQVTNENKHEYVATHLRDCAPVDCLEVCWL